VNGLRGGPDKAAWCTRSSRTARLSLASDVDDDLYRSVPAAFEKVRRSRRMKRARGRRCGGTTRGHS